MSDPQVAMQRPNLLHMIRDELLSRETAFADRFCDVYAASIGFHFFNLHNQNRAVYFEQGRLRNARLHVIMVAPPGFMKSYLIEQFLDGNYCLLNDTGLDTSFLDIVTEAGLVGTINKGKDGEAVEQNGFANEHMYGIVGCDEFSGITGMSKQGHSATLDPALLKILDTGEVTKSLAGGVHQAKTHFTFWASTQPMRFELYGGLFRRFLPVEFIPNENEKEAIRQARRRGRNAAPREYNLKSLQRGIKELNTVYLPKISGIKFDTSLDEYFNTKKKMIPHFEEVVYERFVIGYTIMQNRFTDTLHIRLDDELKKVLDRLVDWRFNLKRGSASSQGIRILVEHEGKMHEGELKKELLDFGMTWSDSSLLMGEMVRDGIIKRSPGGDIELKLQQ